MQNLGYSSIYMKRSGQKRDGCGLFYKHDWYVQIFCGCFTGINL